MNNAKPTLYGLLYQVGTTTSHRYFKGGFRSVHEAERYRMQHTSAFTWWICKTDANGDYHKILTNGNGE